MGAIPTSDMPGHRQLHERVCAALDRCAESAAVEFKESAPWESLKWRLVKTLMAMGNLRDGGVVVIGVSEAGQQWNLAGITKDHLETYDVDTVTETLAKYASPPVELDVVLVKYQNGPSFLAIQAHEFGDLPFVCKRNGPDTERPFHEGDIFVRPPGKPQTKKVTVAQELHALLALAAEKRARAMLQAGHRIGLVPSVTATQHFDEELAGL
jgi:hypothetical protein